ncbi:hypothetical protein [Aeromonas dhakensis]|nr:hypothetical protein [Aeromonas dhakensis]
MMSIEMIELNLEMMKLEWYQAQRKKQATIELQLALLQAKRNYEE